jgi:hypothetical protein
MSHDGQHPLTHIWSDLTSLLSCPPQVLKLMHWALEHIHWALEHVLGSWRSLAWIMEVVMLWRTHP